MVVYLITGVALLVYLVLVWLLGSWLHLQAPDIWILRGGLALIGIVAAAVILWFYRKSKKARQGDEPVAGQPGVEDIDLLVHEALGALKKSTLGRGAALRNQPLIFFLGEPGSAKTNTIIHSGLDPELLAGQVYQDSNVIPTRVANVWHTQPAILVDPAGNFVQQPNRWKRLVQLVRPGRASSAFSTSQQAPRAAVICFDIANFLKQGSGEATLASARSLSARLHDVTQMLGISLPIYVLFTKLDRLQGFTEFARMLNPNEAAQVLGATMPIRSLSSGVYSEEESKRLAAVFDELFFSMADKRLDLLARENDTETLPAIYEFPRELRKLRTLLVQFLVELARPSRLNVNPFLRGFYFSGVRPVFVEDGVSAAPRAAEPDARFDGAATLLFNAPVAQPAAVAAARSAGRRKVPEWTFLPRLFNEVIVKDRVALAASGVSSKVNLIRRIAWISAALICFIAIVGFLVSFLGNHQLEQNVQATAAEVHALSLNPHQLPSVSDLQKLDKLREELQTLATYDRQGVPLHLRWFLYVGDKISPDARRIYFTAFRQLLFEDAQAAVLSDLKRLPDQPGVNDSYDLPYDELKTHLITAQYYDKSTKDFPARILTDRWSETKKPDSQTRDLAQRQFEYYGGELKSGDPIDTKPDQVAIGRARAYLAKFGGIDRYYRPLIDRASSSGDAIFYVKFPDATSTIESKHVVKGAFTPAGFQAFSAAIRDISRSLAGEEWVLGPQTAKDLDQGAVQQPLMQRYQQDFVKEWEAVLRDSQVPKYNNLNDADHSLVRLTDPTSPLLELLWFIASNTNLDTVRDPFASVDGLEPPGAPNGRPDQLRQPANANYMQALTTLEGNVHIAAQTPAGLDDPNISNQVMTAAAQARGAATLAAGSRVDNTYHTEQTLEHLLLEPIVNVEQLKPDASGSLNGKGAAMCAQLIPIVQKFPFNSRSSQDVNLDEFNNFFAPTTGSLWTLYQQSLKQLLVKQGTTYKATGGGNVTINPAFVNFFNRMATVTDAFYSSGAAPPNFSYSLTTQPSNIQGQLSLTIAGQPLGPVGQQKTFKWTGASERIAVSKGIEGLHDYSGSWAVFHFVDEGAELLHSRTNLRWNLLQSDGKPISVNGEAEFYAYQLQAGTPNPFEIVGTAGMRCEPKIALK